MKKKIAIGLAVAASIVATYSFAQKTQPTPFNTVEHVELNQYLGTWYEIARKPMYFQKKCAKDVQAKYSLKENGKIRVENSCIGQSGKIEKAEGEAFVVNAPHNSQLKVSFLPQAIRWLPVGRGDYWILKLDSAYQFALIGDPKRKYLWLLSREPKISKEVWQEYTHYAQQLGYDLSDFNQTIQTQK